MPVAIITDWIQYLTLQGRSFNTKDSYTKILTNFCSWLDARGSGLLTATQDIITAWRIQLSVSDSSVRNYITAVRSFYRWAVRVRHLLSDNPALEIPTPKSRRRLPRPIADVDLEHAIDCASCRVRPWLVLAGYCGLRCCEIARLRREHIMETAPDPCILVQGKGGRERIVPLTPYVWHELQPTLPPRGFLYLRSDGLGGHVPPATVSKVGNAHLRRCGIEATMHQARHRFGTVSYQAEHDLRAVQELLGHARIDTTAGYAAHSNPAAIRAASAAQPARWLRAVQDNHRGLGDVQ